MKKIITVVILLLIPYIAFTQINEDEFFNVSNIFLKIHQIDKGEFLFYGDKGGILRTYDSGNTWIQNYAGTKNSIIQLVNHKDYVVGLTNQNEFMASQDKGSHWFVDKLTDSIVSIDANDDFIIVATESENLLLTSDVGKSWSTIKATEYSIKSIKIVTNRIFILDQYNRLYYSDDIGINWINVELPGELNGSANMTLQRDGKHLSIRNVNSIYLIMENLEIVTNKLNSSKIDQYIVTDFNIIHVNGNSISREFYLNNYSKLDNIESEISRYKNHYFEGNTLQAIDIFVEDNLVFMTCPNKTILKSVDYGKNWTIESYTPMFSVNYFKFWDENNWSIISNSGVILNSTNGGSTFRPGKDIILDTTVTPPIASSFNSFNYFDKDSAIYFLRHSYSNTMTRDLYTTNDGGNTLKAYPDKFLSKAEYLTNIGEDLYFNRDLSYGGRYGRTIVYYKLSDGFKVDSINSLDSMNSNFHKIVNYENKIYIFRSKLSEGSSNISIEYSDDSFETISNIHTFNSSEIDNIQLVYKSRNGNIYFSSTFTNTYYRLDTKTNEVFEVETPFSFLSYYNETEYIEDQQYFASIGWTGDEKHYKYVEVSFDGVDMIIDTVGHNTFGLLPTKFINSDGIVLISSAQNIWKKIEPDRLTSVELDARVEILPVWPSSPSPNPAKNQVKVKFYTERSDIINNLFVKLISISTGTEYIINNYELNIIDNWQGEISFDISDYLSGSYLIDLTLDGYSKNTKLIITK